MESRLLHALKQVHTCGVGGVFRRVSLRPQCSSKELPFPMILGLKINSPGIRVSQGSSTSVPAELV